MITASSLVDFDRGYVPLLVYAVAGMALILASVFLFARASRSAWAARKAALTAISRDVSPACLAQKRFVRRYRGYEPDQVAARLRSVADTMRHSGAGVAVGVDDLDVVRKGWDRTQVGALVASATSADMPTSSRGSD
jgi:hypothetical protein